MSEIEILCKFRLNLVEFVDDLLDQFPHDPKLILLRIYFADQAIISDVIKRFIQNINKEIELDKKSQATKIGTTTQKVALQTNNTSKITEVKDPDTTTRNTPQKTGGNNDVTNSKKDTKAVDTTIKNNPPKDEVKTNDKKPIVKDLIQLRDESLITKHNIFSLSGCDKGMSKVLNNDTESHFRTLWVSGQLNKEDKIVIWRWIDRLVNVSDEYILCMSNKK